jgi:predicted ATP-dependent protease
MFTFNQKYSIMQEKKSKTLPIHLNDESDDEFLMKKTGRKSVKSYTSLKVSTISRKVFGTQKPEAEVKRSQKQFHIKISVIHSGKNTSNHTKLTETAISAPKCQVEQYYKVREPTFKEPKASNYQVLGDVRTL